MIFFDIRPRSVRQRARKSQCALVIPSEVEGSRVVTVKVRDGVPRLRFAALGMTAAEMHGFAAYRRNQTCVRQRRRATARLSICAVGGKVIA